MHTAVRVHLRTDGDVKFALLAEVDRFTPTMRRLGRKVGRVYNY